MKNKKLTNRRLAEMWCELNTFKVPKELKRQKSPYKKNHKTIATGAMVMIEALLSKEYILKVWNEYP